MKRPKIGTTILIALILFSIPVGYYLLKDTPPSVREEIGDHKEIGHWTCSMHPAVKMESAGKCPICSMALIYAEPNEDFDMPNVMNTDEEIWHCADYPDVTSSKEDTCPIDGTPMIKKKAPSPGKIVARVKLRKSQVDHFKAETFPVQSMKMKKKLRVLGKVVQPEEEESNIPARIGGRVEKIYIASAGSRVSQGDPVVDIYSPELISTGEEFIIAKKNYLRTEKDEYKLFMEQARKKLLLFGIADRQIRSWHQKKYVPQNITIYSPVSGIVKRKNAVIGKYFKMGQSFYDLADISNVWVEMDIYEQDSGMVAIGQDVDLAFAAYEGEKRRSKIDFVSPVLNEMTRTLIVRATLGNKDGKLKPGMAAEGNITFHFPGEPLVIPKTAVIDTGKRKVVWATLGENKYIAKIIETGFESQGYVEVTAGLEKGQRVVMEGNFLLDAQARLFGGYEEMETK